jgi:four helix bundle protein
LSWLKNKAFTRAEALFFNQLKQRRTTMLKTFRTYQLAQIFYRDCQRLSFKLPLKDQFERAVLSIVLNLAEGSGKLTQKDRRKFYSIALGSLREVHALIQLAGYDHLDQQIDRLGAHLYRLIQNPGGE